MLSWPQWYVAVREFLYGSATVWWRIRGTFFHGFPYLVIPPVYLSTLIRVYAGGEKMKW